MKIVKDFEDLELEMNEASLQEMQKLSKKKYFDKENFMKWFEKKFKNSENYNLIKKEIEELK